MKESRTVEYKAEITNGFLKTVSAFANFGSGEIRFGVDDDGRAVGLSAPEQACLDIENRINDSISPKPDYTLAISRPGGVVTLSVQKGAYTPYLYKGKAYRRSDTATVEVDRVELDRLVLEGRNLYFEQLPCGRDALSFTRLEEMLCERLCVSGATGDILRTLGFLTPDMKYNNAAALFADENDFPGVDAARFGRDLDVILDRETFAGVSLLSQYLGALGLYRRYYQYEKIEGAERRRVERIPEKAFREALANALVHRTWDIRAHIRVSMFDDRIEIVSPGGLPAGLSEEEYLNGYISALRNPVIGNVFFRLGLIEMFGTGIRRIRQSYAALGCAPSFAVGENSIAVTLPAVDARAGVAPSAQRILAALPKGVLLSSGEIAERTGMNRTMVIRCVRELCEKGYVEIIGRGRGTRYGRK